MFNRCARVGSARCILHTQSSNRIRAGVGREGRGCREWQGEEEREVESLLLSFSWHFHISWETGAIKIFFRRAIQKNVETGTNKNHRYKEKVEPMLRETISRFWWETLVTRKWLFTTRAVSHRLSLYFVDTLKHKKALYIHGQASQKCPLF